jgi:hypothetical protein
MHDNAAQCKQPLRNLQMPTLASRLEGVIVHGVNVHAAQRQQPLGKAHMPMATGKPKRKLVVGMDVHAAHPQQPLGNHQVPVRTDPVEHGGETIKVHIASLKENLDLLKVPKFAGGLKRLHAAWTEEMCHAYHDVSAR